MVPHFVEEIKRNRLARNLDRVVCCNEKCRYECVWSQADNGTRICIFALDLYDWLRLGDLHHFTSRGCVGSYVLSGGTVPAHATRSTQLIFNLGGDDVSLDPFAD